MNQIHKETKRATVVVNPDDEEGQVERNEDEEMEEEGQVPVKEYDYLLTMPLWSLSEEKIEELNKLMNEKKDEHHTLEKTHIH